MLARMAKYYNIHGWQRTVKKYKISSSTMQKVVRSKGVHRGPSVTLKFKPLQAGNGLHKAFVRHAAEQKFGDAATERTGKQLYIAAKRLEHALIEHRRAGNPPSDVESYAFFLLREILK